MDALSDVKLMAVGIWPTNTTYLYGICDGIRVVKFVWSNLSIKRRAFLFAFPNWVLLFKGAKRMPCVVEILGYDVFLGSEIKLHCNRLKLVLSYYFTKF